MAESSHQIFLSHSGLDADQAVILGRRLLDALTGPDLNVGVFNTSEPEHRFQELENLLDSGEEWKTRAEKYEIELRTYLETSLVESDAFILLISPQSLAASSEIIAFEIEMAYRVTKKMSSERIFFIPCAIRGADFAELPREAQYFYGVDLDSKFGFEQLLQALTKAISY